MNQTNLQRACALYEYDQGKSAAELPRNIQEKCVENAMSEIYNRRLHYSQDIPREDCLVMLDRQALKEVVHSDFK